MIGLDSIIFDDPNDKDVYFMSWYVLKTKPRQEIKAKEFFEKMDIESYIPMERKYIHKKKQGEYKLIPIISTFLFFRMDKLDYDLINQNPYGGDILRMHKKVIVVKDSEIEVMRQHIDPTNDSLDFKGAEEGKNYTIGHGIFKGKSGKVLEKRKNKIYLFLDSLQLSICIETN